MQPVAGEGQIGIYGMALEYRLFGPSPALSPTIIMSHEGLGSIKPGQVSPTYFRTYRRECIRLLAGRLRHVAAFR